MFDAHSFSATEILISALSAAREWQNAQVNQTQKHRIFPRIAEIHENVTVIRSNAAWKESDNFAGLGWVLYGDDGILKFSAMERFVITPVMAEGLAMRKAMEKSREMGIRRIRCEADSKQLMACIKKREPVPEIYGIVEDILAMASSFECCSFVWIPRIQNVVADGLAKQVAVVIEDVNSLT